MAWWIWALIAWSTAASVAVLWLAAEVSHLRSRQVGESSAEPLELPWQPETSPDPSPLFQFNPNSLVATAQARLSWSRLGDRTASRSALQTHWLTTVATAQAAISRGLRDRTGSGSQPHTCWVTTVATARRAIFGLRGGAWRPAARIPEGSIPPQGNG